MSFLIILLVGCKTPDKVYTTSDSLIELNAIRQQEPISDTNLYAGMSTNDGRFWDNVYPKVTGIPDSLERIKVYYNWINNIQALYQSYKAGLVDKKDFDSYYNAWGSDTTDCSSNYVKTFVIIVTGFSASGQKYYLFDSNNNYDFADEVPFKIAKNKKNMVGNYNSKFQPYKIIYEKFIDNKIQQDSTWIAFFERGKYMWLQFCEHTSSSFQFDSIKYQINLYPGNGIHALYKKSTFAKILDGLNKKSKLINAGEYIKLGNTYYQLSCSSDGLKIYFTKNTNALSKGSTQIGMPPILFKAKTYLGDSINFPHDFIGKYVLLDFWSTSCPPCVQEIRDYYIDIYQKFGGDQFEIIGIADNLPHELDNFIKKYKIRWTIIPDKKQKLINKKYHIFEIPTLYLINPEGKIIAKGDELRFGNFESKLKENIKPNK